MKALNPPIPSWHGRRCWIIGASSGIGAAVARQLLDAGAQVMLSARRAPALFEIAQERPQALVAPLDIADPAALAAAAERMVAAFGGIDLVLIAAGSYVPMRADAFDLGAATALVELNLVGTLNCLHATLPQLLRQQSGCLALVSSVAGYSGLPKALAYGPTKAALINLAETLYIDLHERGIGVALVNPGFVDTPLTAQNDFRMPALMRPQDAAAELLAGLARGDFHVHFPRRFTNWLRFARLLPYRLYFKLVRRIAGP